MPDAPKTILLSGTLDAKGMEYAYVHDLIIARGHRVLAMDAGAPGEPSFAPDISATDVVTAGGSSRQQLRGQNDRGAAVAAMMRGAGELAMELHGASWPGEVRWRSGFGRSGRHRHRNRSHATTAGTCIYIPQGVYHSTLNTGSETMKLIVVYSPAGSERQLREIPGVQVLAPGEAS